MVEVLLGILLFSQFRYSEILEDRYKNEIRNIKIHSVGGKFPAAQGYNRRDCNSLLRLFDGVKRPILSFLWGTFRRREAVDCPARFLELPRKSKMLIIDVTNWTCLRSPRYCEQGYEPFAGLTETQVNQQLEKNRAGLRRKLVERFKRIDRWIEAHRTNETLIGLSYGLEHRMTVKAYKNFHRTLKRIFGNRVFYVNNPAGNSVRDYPYLSDLGELHDGEATRFGDYAGFERACVWSNDGIDISFDGGNYQPLRGAMRMQDIADVSARKRNTGCRILLWFNAQGVQRNGFLEPSRRDLSFPLEPIIQLNKLLLDFQKEGLD